MTLSTAANAAATENALHSLTLYYDGHCPLCVAEIHFLTARNRRGLRKPYLMPGREELETFKDGLLRLGLPEIEELARAAGLRS